MFPPVHSLDVVVHSATLLPEADSQRLGLAGPALLVSTGHELMLHDLRLQAGAGEVDLMLDRPGLQRLGSGYEMPAAALLCPGSDTLLLADLHPATREFTLLRARLGAADRRAAEPLLRTSGQPLQMALVGSQLFYADHQRGALMVVDIDGPQPRQARVVMPQLESPVGVVARGDGSELLVSERRVGRVISIRPDLLTEDALLQVWQVERTGLHAPQLLSFDESDGSLLLPQFAGFGYVQALDLAAARLQPRWRGASHQRPLAAWRRGPWLIVAETGGLRCWDQARLLNALREGAERRRRAADASEPGAAGLSARSPQLVTSP